MSKDLGDDFYSKNKSYRKQKALRDIVKLLSRLIEIYPFAFALDSEIPLCLKHWVSSTFLQNRKINYANLANVNLDKTYKDVLSFVIVEKKW